MNNLFVFYLRVNYRAPSKENMFLDESWGYRDVRGPYLNGILGQICVNGVILSSELPSTISLILSVSNRCPMTSLLTKVSTPKEEITKHIPRNGSSEFVFTSAQSRSRDKVLLSVETPELKDAANQALFQDILAIDELSIERFQ